MLALTGLSCRRSEEDIITRGSAGDVELKEIKGMRKKKTVMEG